MYREIITDFEKWYNNTERKPLLVTGGRCIGKSSAIKDFGDGFFDNTLIFDLKENGYNDFDDQFLRERLFIPKFIKRNREEKIELPANTLIVFENLDMENEISAIDLFKRLEEISGNNYFCIESNISRKKLFGEEDYKEYADIIEMYPISFGEFLIVNNKYDLSEKIEKQKEIPLSEENLKEIIKLLKIFYIVGGMPEAVKIWLENKDINKVEEVKKNIISIYEEDFNKIENKALRKKIFEIWKSIIIQLDDENKKFQYGKVRITARAREYSEGVEWLNDRGYVKKLFKINDDNSFELFVTDVGLLTTLYNVSYEELCEDRKSILLKNGAIIEQFVFQELIYNKNIGKIHYWTSSATARIAFVFEDSDQVIPIDINVSGNTKAQSLKVYRQKYKNPMSVQITYEKFSMNNGILNIPVYSIWNL